MVALSAFPLAFPASLRAKGLLTRLGVPPVGVVLTGVTASTVVDIGRGVARLPTTAAPFRAV